MAKIQIKIQERKIVKKLHFHAAGSFSQFCTYNQNNYWVLYVASHKGGLVAKSFAKRAESYFLQLI